MVADIITKIEKVLKVKKSFNGAGISNGVLGLSMFYYYQYLHTKEDFFLTETIRVLEESLEMLNENYTSISPQNDIIEIGHYVHYLYEKGVLDYEVQSLLLEFDDLIEKILEERIATENLDSITGVFAPFNYLLKRSNKNKKLKEVIKIIARKAIEQKNDAYWSFNLRATKEPIIELGLNHGVSGVVSVLLDSFKNAIEKDTSKRLAVLGLRFLETQMNKENTCWFPQEANTTNYPSYQNISYGDVGIGFTFYKAGKILKEKKWTSLGISILENAASFRDDSGKYIKDANLIYGASGLYSFFHFMNKECSKFKFHQAKEYWFNKILEKGSNNTVWAGYNTYYNGIYDFAQLGFSQGICGIGIALITRQIDSDNKCLEYLNFKL